jgi:hypothetical protein
MPDTTATDTPPVSDIAAKLAEKKAAADAAAGATPTAPPAENTVDTDALEKKINKAKEDLATDEAKLAQAKKDQNVVIQYDEASLEMGGVKKLFREAGDSNTGKPDIGHVVQQGGGGSAVLGDSGAPIR